MSSRLFQHKNSTLHYTTIGNGPHTLLMFHGFGQDSTSFHLLTPALPDQYTVYLFDLYFHGRSSWGYGELPLEKSHWTETLNAFFLQNKIERFALGGYSLGGKFALATLESFPDKTDAIILLAPDGIKISFWYRLATYPILFRKIFKRMIDHPEIFLAIARTLNACGLVDKGVLKFATFQMNTGEKRKRVYYSWVVFRRLRFDLNKIARLINGHKIPITIVVGQYDKVINAGSMHLLLDKLKQVRFETPATGHTGLIAASEPYFQNLTNFRNKF